MRFLAVPLAFALVLALAAPGRAQNEDTVLVEPDRVVVRPKTFIDITEVEVRGAMVKPSTVFVHPRGKVKFRNLIELRASFRPELATSPDHL